MPVHCVQHVIFVLAVVNAISSIRFVLELFKLVQVFLLLGNLLGQDKQAIVKEELHLFRLVLRQRCI